VAKFGANVEQASTPKHKGPAKKKWDLDNQTLQMNPLQMKCHTAE